MSRAPGPITVLLADDHTLFRAGVAEILAAQGDLRVVGEAETDEDTVTLAREQQPDVVLLDIEMPGPGAAETLRRILRASPSSKVIVVTMHDEARLVRILLALGACAYVVKNATSDELLAAVRAVQHHDDRVIVYVSRATLESLEASGDDLLSARELEVLSLAAGALTNAQIAVQLFISEGTVKRHLSNVYAKLGVNSRVDAINKATAAGLIPNQRTPAGP